LLPRGEKPERVLLDNFIDLLILLSEGKNRLNKLLIKLVLAGNKIFIEETLLQSILVLGLARLAAFTRLPNVSHTTNIINKP
jgi:hypothetical protein